MELQESKLSFNEVDTKHGEMCECVCVCACDCELVSACSSLYDCWQYQQGMFCAIGQFLCEGEQKR